MNEGIIKDSLFAKMIINGQKKYDYRKHKPPLDKIGTPLYLITNRKIIGEIMITSCNYNQIKHAFFWEFAVLKKYPKAIKYRKLTDKGEWATEVMLH